ncbi:MAG: asparagine synthetase B [Candidatus Edwardsbacteria bacterium]
MIKRMFIGMFCLLMLVASVSAEKMLIYMDLAQIDHLKAYGIAYYALQEGTNVEWLLNYRGGAFMMDASPELERTAKLRGVAYSLLGGSQVALVYAEIEQNNMEVVLLEKAPSLAVYVPPGESHWDDAVCLALDYAEIPYTKVWDEEVLAGALEQYDWLHLHHEDFTGQYGKFYAMYRNTDWYQNDVRTNEKMAKKLGLKKVSQLKLSIAKKIKEYVANGGFLFAMCSAPITLDIAFAGEGVDFVPAEFDGDPIDPEFQQKVDFQKTFAFENFNLIIDPFSYEHSDIDTSPESHQRGPNTYFTLFDFSAKFDPVPTMLTQNHVALINCFMGQDTGFRREKIKKNIVIMAEVEGTDEVKYLHGNFGRGTFTFYGGHDPEDFEHRVDDPWTKLELHKNSPGYRLILNNILFPAAKKKELKT